MAGCALGTLLRVGEGWDLQGPGCPRWWRKHVQLHPSTAPCSCGQGSTGGDSAVMVGSSQA